MQFEEFFEQLAAGDPALAERFAQTDGELELAKAIATWRAARGLNQTDLAERMHVAQSVVSRLEQAGRTPSVPTLWKLATALDVQFVIGPAYRVAVEDSHLHRSEPQVAMTMYTGRWSSQAAHGGAPVAAAAGTVGVGLRWREGRRAAATSSAAARQSRSDGATLVMAEVA